jgi:hypothetical protein
MPQFLQSAIVKLEHSFYLTSMRAIETILMLYEYNTLRSSVYLFVVYLTTISVAQAKASNDRMINE